SVPVILRGAAFTLAYLAFTVSAFWVIVQAYGLPLIGAIQALAIYSFVLAIIILNPLPSDLGISELSGVGIFLAFGVAPAAGLTVMLITRFSLLLSTDVLAAASLLIFRQELGHITLGPALPGETAAVMERQEVQVGIQDSELGR
ncbi:MAG: flippase-like domain-containing protein, partial [Chloroflexota bacterium]|nr:flippase-like domain-containing protein [Chloroflexota bacterium]